MSAQLPRRSRAVPRPPQTRLGRLLGANTSQGQQRNHKPRIPIVEETSAGGLVVALIDSIPSVAVIARRNRLGNIEWCLPKGHLEAGETPMDAAVREIHEETGIQGTIITHLASIDYWFAGSGRRIHKVVHHFLLDAKSYDLTVENDPDQEAEDAAWMPLETVANHLAYPNERRVVGIARELLDLGD